MTKELTFLQIGEERQAHNFVAKIEKLIQIPIGPKTNNGTVYDVLERHCEGNSSKEAAYEKFMIEMGKFDRKQPFFEAQHFIPEQGISLFAIFTLKSI